MHVIFDTFSISYLGFFCRGGSLASRPRGQGLGPKGGAKKTDDAGMALGWTVIRGAFSLVEDPKGPGGTVH